MPAISYADEEVPLLESKPNLKDQGRTYEQGAILLDEEHRCDPKQAADGDGPHSVIHRVAGHVHCPRRCACTDYYTINGCIMYTKHHVSPSKALKHVPAGCTLAARGRCYILCAESKHGAAHCSCKGIDSW